MNRKKSRILLGKQIRQATGIKLPVAMRAAKLLLKEERDRLFSDPMMAEVISQTYCDNCGWDCSCTYMSGSKYKILGPRGSWDIR